MRKRPFGRAADGRLVEQVVLESDRAAVSILSLGAIVRDWRIDGPDGSLPMVLGFPTVEDYVHHARSHGAICGRVANRTRDARFTLDGREYRLTPNEGPHQLHGGPEGLGARIWEMEIDGAAGSVELRLASPDGDQGWPGAVDFAVSYRLDGTRLVCEMKGVPDRPTPINLANHNYYNFGGGGTVKDHIVWIAASDYTPTRRGPDPDWRDRAGRGHAARLPRAARDRRHRARRQPGPRRRARCGRAGGAGRVPADRGGA